MVKLSECEEQVMIVIWNSKEAPDLQMALKDVNVRFEHEWKPQTVSTFLARLVKKGYLSMERRGRYCYYTPTVSLEEYRSEKMKSVVDALFGEDKDEAAKCLNKI